MKRKRDNEYHQDSREHKTSSDESSDEELKSSTADCFMDSRDKYPRKDSTISEVSNIDGDLNEDSISEGDKGKSQTNIKEKNTNFEISYIKEQDSDSKDSDNFSSNDPLRVFHVLDECEGSESDTAPNEDGTYSSDSDISDDEIEALLEQKLKEEHDESKKGENKYNLKYTEKKMVFLEELGHNHFDLLPEGWIQIVHRSGMPLYLHKASRVCTFSRPYYLGQGSAKRHLAPLSAIPCLQYRRALEVEKQASANTNNPSGSKDLSLHSAKIETAEENKASQSLSPFAIQQYCKQLFKFRSEKKLHFLSWTDRRKYFKAKKRQRQHQRPTFPDGTKLIKFPIVNPEDGPDAKPRGEWILNPNGKSCICILHEYVQHALKKQPTYEFKPLENPATPYSATVIISGIKYGSGIGSSKKQAKLAAAKTSLEMLIPEMREKICNDTVKSNNDHDEDRLSIFDEIKIDDPRVAEFCSKATEPSPYAILLTCLQRNFGHKEMSIDSKINPVNRQRNEFVMTVGKHVARVTCKSKKDGKQMASQMILQALHPHISTWGSLLRLYGNKSIKNIKEKKQEEHQVTMLQSKASLNSPNYAILNKLRSEMLKLAESANKVVPIGVFIAPEDFSLPSSGTELSKVDI